ncbi:uncharacterized protein [Eucyclogobius newberryi]|uniref:uncharacterized protein n=1 Tax=Eucyclogobius newberryi TaxID=166745 RepID=UPI003B5AA28A
MLYLDSSHSILGFKMTSTENGEQETELRNIVMKMQQLVERKKMLYIMKELKKRVGNEQTDETDEIDEQELINIDEKLNQLETIRAELQMRTTGQLNHDEIQKPKKVSLSEDSLPGSSFESSTPQVIILEPPPNYPAPEVIFNHQNIQFKPTKTQCPGCSAFITTKTCTTVSSITWLACIMIAMMGCVAGCCFLPFCLDSFKNTSHKCPKCNTLISTVKKL